MDKDKKEIELKMEKKNDDNVGKTWKKYKIHWLGGKEEVIEGWNISMAFSKAGYGGGALKAVDWIENMERDENE